MNDTPFQRTIPAAVGTQPGIITVDVSGKILSVLSSTGKFSVKPDNGGTFEMSGGRYYGNPDAAEFGRLTLYNFTGAAVTVDCIAGDKVYKPDGTISSVNTNVTTSGKNADTYTLGTAIAGNTNFTGLDGVNRRKQIIVQNKGAAEVLIEGAAGVGQFSIVSGDPAFTVETGGLIKVTFGAGVKDARILEVFYQP